MKEEYVKYFKSELEKSRFRFTPQREKVAEYIANHKGVFSAEQVGKKLKEIDRASVYRILKLFAKLDLIHPVVKIKDKEYYEIHSKFHHHHEICTRCGTTACIACPLSRKKSKILKFEHHTFVITGLCKSCTT